ncbi:kinase [Nonomuraea pusilla]|uniref:kinase n=1 Tax=Nonomuraea pusilla TaxID=46177 RepID=UPI003333540C
MRTGSPQTRLIVLRGNSGSGKTSVARAVRAAYGYGLALVGQDTVRRELLREPDVQGGVNIGLIETIVRYSLDHGYHVVLEGILAAGRYADMLHALRRDHAGTSTFFYLDVPFPETLRRHETRPQRHEFGAGQMREWYQEKDLLPGGHETVVGPDSSLDETVLRVLRAARLTGAADLAPGQGGRGEPERA